MMDLSPLPWTAQPVVGRPDEEWLAVLDADGQEVALLPRDSHDATLIARAPELLAVARQMHDLMENLWKAVPWGRCFGLDVAALNTVPARLEHLLREFPR
jgi:hypothetical protein